MEKWKSKSKKSRFHQDINLSQQSKLIALLYLHLGNYMQKHPPDVFCKKWCSQKFLKSPAQVFSCEFCEISKNTFFTEHLRTTISVYGCVKDDKECLLNNLYIHHAIKSTNNYKRYATIISAIIKINIIKVHIQSLFLQHIGSSINKQLFISLCLCSYYLHLLIHSGSL